MEDGEDDDALGFRDVEDGVREAPNKDTTNVAMDANERRRRGGNLRERCFDARGEVIAEPRLPLVVP